MFPETQNLSIMQDSTYYSCRELESANPETKRFGACEGDCSPHVLIVAGVFGILLGGSWVVISGVIGFL